jgi:hypothetical protein
MSDSEIKVTDAETLEWMRQLSDSEKIELKRRALEQNAVRLLQPKAAPPDFARMTDSEFNLWKIHNSV